MTVATDGARSLQTNRRRPVPVVPIVPAIPLVHKRNGHSSASAITKDAEPKRQHMSNGDEAEEGGPVVESLHRVNGENPRQSSPAARHRESLQVETNWHDSSEQVVVDSENTRSLAIEPETPALDYPQNLQSHFQQDPLQHHPSHMPSTSSSAGSGTYQRYPLQPRHQAAHHHHFSNGSIVFGGYSDSTTSSPAAVQTVDMQHYPILLPGHPSDHHLPKAFTGGNGPHFLATHINPVYHQPHAPFYGSPDMFFPGAKYHYPPPHDRRPFFAPLNGHMFHHPSERAVDVQNGRTSSTASSGFDSIRERARQSNHLPESGPDRGIAADQEAQSHHGLTNGKVHAVQSSIATNEEHLDNSEDSPSNSRTSLSVHKYFGSFFASREYSDCTLEVRHIDGRFERLSLPAHRIILGQSPTLKFLGNVGQSLSQIIQLETADRFVELDSFREALRYLYLGTMPVIDHWVSNGSPRRGSIHAMDFFIGYAAAGHILKIPAITAHGGKLASELLGWGTMERALSFALEGREFDGSLASRNSNEVANANDDVSDAQAVLSKSTEASPTSPSSPFPTQSRRISYGPVADELLDAIMSFITVNIPPDFIFDGSVSELSLHPRLPGTDNRSGQLNHRLKSIKFGDYPQEDDTRADSTIVVISKILLSLPFELLKSVLGSSHLGGESSMSTQQRSSLAASVIQERERRRKLGVGGQNIGSAQRADRIRKWPILGWKESLVTESGENYDQVDGGKFTLEREWDGSL